MVDQLLINEFKNICNKYSPKKTHFMSQVKSRYDTLYERYFDETEKIKNIKELVIDDGKQVQDIINSINSKYNTFLEREFQRVVKKFTCPSDLSKIIDKLGISGKHVAHVQNLFGHELSLKIGRNCLNMLIDIMNRMVKTLLHHHKLSKLCNLYECHISKYKEDIEIIECFDDKYNLGHLKYQILYKGVDPKLILEYVLSIENKLAMSVDVYVQAYVILFSITQESFKLNTYIPDNMLIQKNNKTCNKILAKHGDSLKDIDKVIGKKGETMIDYDTLLAKAGVNFKCHLWRLSSFQPDDKLFKLICQFTNNEKSAKYYFTYHVALSQLISQPNSETFQMNLVMKFLLLPFEKDIGEIIDVKAYFKETFQDSSCFDEAFTKAYKIQPKTMLWNMLVMKTLHMDCLLFIKDRIREIFKNEADKIARYTLYYNNFFKLLTADVQHCFLP